MDPLLPIQASLPSAIGLYLEGGSFKFGGRVRMGFQGSPDDGVVYTRDEVVRLTLDLVGYTSGKDLRPFSVLDIGCGYGQFVGEATRRLLESCRRQRLSFEEAKRVVETNVRGVEIARETATHAEKLVRAAFEVTYNRIPSTFDSPIVSQDDFLTHDPRRDFHYIIGNLPYVKYETINKLPSGQKVDWIAKTFTCFEGRADYSVAFMEKALGHLASDGHAALITSNRFTQAEYGKRLRAMLSSSEYHIDEVDVSAVRAFDEVVTAYASIFLLHRGAAGPSRYVKLRTLDEAALARLLRLGLARAKTTEDYIAVSRGSLPRNGEAWSPLPGNVTRVLRRLAKEFEPLAAFDVTIRKGPATGADGVFIGTRDKFGFRSTSAQALLLPVYDWGSAKGGDVRLLLCPYEEGTRDLYEFDELPAEVQAYLLAHETKLRARHMVKEQERDWWGLIDPVDPGVQRLTKALVPDLKLGSSVSLDEGHFIPGHTTVYIAGKAADLHGITSLLRSPLCDLYRMWWAPGLRSNTPRASPKVLSRIPCPEAVADATSALSAAELVTAFDLTQDEARQIASAHALYMASSEAAT